MIPKFNFESQNKNKITLFANKGEAIVFWLSVAGVLTIAIISVFRYATADKINSDYAELIESFSEIKAKMNQLETENENLWDEIDSLKTKITESIKLIEELDSALTQSKRRLNATKASETFPDIKHRIKRHPIIREKFKIK